MKLLSTVAIVGVGLIGGSIGLALKKRKLAAEVVGIGRRQTSLRIARRVGAVDATTTDLAKGVARAELIVICTPVDLIVDYARQAAEHCPEGTLITDAGSTKARIVAALDGRLARGCRFLGSHPLAGSEKSGSAHASADLFEGRIALITPTKSTHAEDYDMIERFWRSLGSVVVQLSPDEHDRALALTSHLPHLTAAALMHTLPDSLFRLTGSGWLDTTRIAAGDAQLWTQIFLHNREHLLAALDRLDHCLAAFREALRTADAAEIEKLLAFAEKNRNALGS